MDVRPRLSRELVASLALAERPGKGVELPPASTLELPEKVVQFGTGAFLRGFVEYFIDAANRRGAFNGSIVAVSSTGGGATRDATLNEQDGLYTLALRGVENGAARQRYRIVSSLSRALSASDGWDAVLALARSESIELVVSNTTEVGIAVDPADAFDARPPRSFPAKLTRFLAERARAFDYDRTRGLVVLPCELIERNGDALRAAVCELSARWRLGAAFDAWLADAVVFCNTLVDRIVPGALAADDADRIERVFGYRDGMVTACEPYALFAIQGNDALRARLGFAEDEPRVVVASDIAPFRERKVRLLNGAHTILVPTALLAGFSSVREACSDARVGGFLRRAMFDEIVPGVDAPGAADFARDVLDRFGNPYVEHALIDIALHGTTKMRVRVVPSIVAFEARTGRVPDSLAFGFAAYLAFMRGEIQAERGAAGLSVPEDREGERVRAAWHEVDLSWDAGVAGLARGVCGDASLWGVDLTAVGGFADAVADHLVRIVRHGIHAALDTRLTEPATT